MKALYLSPLIILIFLWQSVLQFPSDRHQKWLNHTLFKAFSPGHSEDSGLNLYDTRSGSIRMINMLDFNNDSYLDIFVPQDHNQVENEDLLNVADFYSDQLISDIERSPVINFNLLLILVDSY